MQPCHPIRRPRVGRPFQYPLSGRRLCSTTPHTMLNSIAQVSVPSIGSKAVQRRFGSVMLILPPCFSTLYRVEGCAATGKPDPFFAPSRFSTLYRVEGCAAWIECATARADHAFQYPLSGRRLCSTRCGAPGDWRRLGFSTLYRVEGCAAATARDGDAFLELFQYPLSGRRLCSDGLSVLPPAPTTRFSTLYRVEGCAANESAAMNHMKVQFQYPLSGRRLCSFLPG